MALSDLVRYYIGAGCWHARASGPVSQTLAAGRRLLALGFGARLCDQPFDCGADGQGLVHVD